MKKFLFLLSFLSTFSMFGQYKVDFEVCQAGVNEYYIKTKVTVPEGWYVYSKTNSGDGPIPARMEVESNGNIIGEMCEEGKIYKAHDPLFDMEVAKFKAPGATFVIKVKVKDPSKPISGFFEGQTCNDEKCIRIAKDFSLSVANAPKCTASSCVAAFSGAATPIAPANTNVTATKPGTPTVTDVAMPSIPSVGQTVTEPTASVETPASPVATSHGSTSTFSADWMKDLKRPAIDINQPVGNCTTTPTEEKSNSLIWIFLAGFIGGLVALLTPCVFPMIPLTVSYFTKSSKDRATGLRNAFTYGASIIVIYVLLGLLITSLLGDSALNWLSTHWIPNVFFTVIFIVFAISFFGYFEITLPASWVNSTDKASNKGGLLGIFFMAATLGLVSFSCTGPIIGTLLVEASKSSIVGPAVGMFGFSTALALPFGFFAAFPGWLQSLPKSGGWMNTVKVVLGFVEIALAFKFLSTADLTMHWGILKYEVFMAIWILCALGLAGYFFGLIRFPHDSPNAKLSKGSIVSGVLSLALAGYLSTTFIVNKEYNTYTPLWLTSGIAPPVGYSIFYPSDCPHGIPCIKNDYFRALALAKKENKPLFVDFTGHGCQNCRRMEDFVWGKPGVIEHLRKDYIVVSLYVDERTKLDSISIASDGSKMRTTGDVWTDFERINIKQISQPYYLLLSPDEKVLNTPVANTPDVKQYSAFLKCGLENMKKIGK